MVSEEIKKAIGNLEICSLFGNSVDSDDVSVLVNAYKAANARVEVLEAENKQVNADKISWRVGAHAQRTLTNSANERIAELEKQLAEVTAERDTLKAFLDSVPVDAIRSLYETLSYDDMVSREDDFSITSWLDKRE
jgi:hypothetical protein